jgi:hypothetical protein
MLLLTLRRSTARAPAIVDDEAEKRGRCPAEKGDPERVFFVFEEKDLARGIAAVVETNLLGNLIDEVALGVGVNGHLGIVQQLNGKIDAGHAPLGDRRARDHLAVHDRRTHLRQPRQPKNEHGGAERETQDGDGNQSRRREHRSIPVHGRSRAELSRVCAFTTPLKRSWVSSESGRGER